MATPIRDILAPLEPHWDRIVRRPLSDKEIDDLARQVGLPAPAPFRDYLREVGLFQDLTWWGASSIEVYEDPSEFASARQFLSEILPPKKAELFPFGGDGAGNVFCLPPSPDVPCRIHFVDHERAKVSKRKDFADWLHSVVAKVVRGIRKRPPNDRKVWSVQFAFQQTSYADLKGLLASVGDLEEIDSDWTNPSTSPADVTSTERQLALDGELLKVRRLEYEDWDMPHLAFNMQERLIEALERSTIRTLDALFKEKRPDYRLVDYGPLDSTELPSE